MEPQKKSQANVRQVAIDAERQTIDSSNANSAWRRFEDLLRLAAVVAVTVGAAIWCFRDPSWPHVLVAALAPILLLYTVFWRMEIEGRERLFVANGELTYEYRVASRLRQRRSLPIEAVECVDVFETTVKDRRGRNATAYGLHVSGPRGGVTFGRLVPENDLLHVRDTLMAWASAAREALDRPRPSLADAPPASAVLASPVGARLSLTREDDAVVIAWSGWRSGIVRPLATLVFLCAFCCLYATVWLLCGKKLGALRQIVVGSMGVLALYVLVHSVRALWAAATHTSWIFRAGYVETRYRVLGVSWGRTHLLTPEQRLQLFDTETGSPDERAAVGILGATARESTLISMLTREEARWLYAELTRAFPRLAP